MARALSYPSKGPRSATAQAFLTVDFLGLSQRARKLFRAGVLVLSLLSVAAVVHILISRPGNLLPFLAIAVPTLAGIACWSSSKRPGLPLMPLFLVQQGVIYGLPLVGKNQTLEYVAPGVVSSAGMTVGLFLVCCLGGWYLGRGQRGSRPSRGDLSIAEGRDAANRCLGLAFLLLGCSVAYHVGLRSGILITLLPGGLAGLLSILRTLANAAAMLGALLGGLVIGGRPRSTGTWIYWLLLTVIFFLSVADILLSPASAMILATTVGLALGKRKIPWQFLLVAFALLGFLNQGKFVMRERYWSKDSNSSKVQLYELPLFYVEWASASGSLLFSGGGDSSEGDGGQSIFERVNNLQNLTYVTEAIERRQIPTLDGKTYALIPPLFIPRVLWPNKPRVHQGQIMLNLHFGRQKTVEQTEKTYIAWGLLPEGVGNFGTFLGPVILGGVMGLAIGWLETVSRRKRLFSVEGMVLGGLLLIFAGSYEMVASVFLTATFQFLIAVTIAAFGLRLWFGGGSGSGEAPKKAILHRPQAVGGRVPGRSSPSRTAAGSGDSGEFDPHVQD